MDAAPSPAGLGGRRHVTRPVHTRFIKAGPNDPVAESLFPAQARGNGAAYAPYFFDARRDGDDLVLRYTLSTWNPYQVVLMEHRLVPGEF